MVSASPLPDLAASLASTSGLPGIVLPSPGQARDLIDLPKTIQMKDPFEDVEFWWEDEGLDLGAGAVPGAGAAGSTSSSASAFATVGEAPAGGGHVGGGEPAGQVSGGSSLFAFENTHVCLLWFYGWICFKSVHGATSEGADSRRAGVCVEVADPAGAAGCLVPLNVHLSGEFQYERVTTDCLEA